MDLGDTGRTESKNLVVRTWANHFNFNHTGIPPWNGHVHRYGILYEKIDESFHR